MDIRNRFMKYVKKEENCWLWVGGMDKKGYGRFSMNGRSERASRASYLLFNGPLVEGECALHECDCPACVYPGHLFKGTKKDNNKDAANKGRWIGRRGPEGTKNARSILTEENVLSIRKDRQYGMTLSELADKYSTTCSNVSLIVNRVRWSHI